MNYKNLTFSDSDKERLRENRDAICAWVMENIVPIIDNSGSIYVDYGGVYRFIVYGNEHNFYFTGFRGTGYIGYGDKRNECYDPFEKANPYQIYPIVDNWKIIKRELLHIIEECSKARERIYKFEV